MVLRGLNLPINAKMAPFEPLKDKKALSRLQTLPLYGASIARVLFTWEAFEPERGQYNLDYLNYYLTLVEVRPISLVPYCSILITSKVSKLNLLKLGYFKLL